ncbi:MAG: CapA family protein [Muribaculaceae bacterium]|nr:CapA family protein [Muribaculaceae bacterium]
MLFETILSLFLSATTPQTATLVFAGDAMQHQKQIDVAKVEKGVYDYSGCFENITPWISDADYAVVNLETPLGDSNFTGYPCFNAPVSYAEALKSAGFDLFLTANNHTLDRRDAGLRRTIALLDSLEVDHIGTYCNATSRDSLLPLIKDINGFKVGFLNYTYGTNGIQPRNDVVVDMIDKELIKSDVTNARELGAEILVVAIHWGVEYVLLPPAQVKELANFLCQQDVDLIIGGHPHVIQPMEMRSHPESGRKQLLVYSLGNLISNMRTRDTRGGAMVKVTLDRDSLGVATVKEAEYMPHFTVPPVTSKDNFSVVLLPESSPVDSVIPAQWRPAARAWLNSVIPVFNKHNIDVRRAK